MDDCDFEWDSGCFVCCYIGGDWRKICVDVGVGYGYGYDLDFDDVDIDYDFVNVDGFGD